MPSTSGLRAKQAEQKFVSNRSRRIASRNLNPFDKSMPDRMPYLNLLRQNNKSHDSSS